MPGNPGPHESEWTLVTVTYNSAAQLRQCWRPSGHGAARWIVVDNASTDDSPAIAAALGAEVVHLPTNIGFSAANNVGLAMTTSPWIGFVNPDVEIVAADLERLAATSRSCHGLVAPQLVNTDGSRQANARGLPFLADKVANRSIALPGSRLADYARDDVEAPTYIAWAMGAAVVGPTSAFVQLGGWDERFFIYYEDHDLGLRAWAHGLTFVLDPEVRWTHQWQRATKRPSLGPWKHEIASLRRFYSAYPYLLTRRRYRRHRVELGSLPRLMWTKAP